jgi:hypothetical protein
LQHLVVVDPLCQRRVEAGAALFDKSEVEARGIGNCLQMVCRSQVGVGAWKRRKLAGGQSRNCLREAATEIGILRPTAVPRPLAGIHGKLH